MLQALFQNKLGHAIQDGCFKCIEDTLTSSVIGLLQYLPDELFWSLLRTSCGESSKTLPESIGTISDVHFWERLSADGTYNSLCVEPDVWIETTDYDILIEAKKSDSSTDNAQNIHQWFNEIVALKRNSENSSDRKLIFLALGGNSTLKDQVVEINDYLQIVHTGSWYDLLRGVYNLKRMIEQEHQQKGSANYVRILDDVIRAMQLHGIVNTIWLDSLSSTKIHFSKIPYFAQKWSSDNLDFFKPIINKQYSIDTYSLSEIWKIK